MAVGKNEAPAPFPRVLDLRTPRLTRSRSTAVAQVAVSGLVHVAALAIAAAVIPAAIPDIHESRADAIASPQQVDVPRLVYLASDRRAISGGGGGGGNRQSGPTRRAQGVGSDAATLQTRKPAPGTGTSALTVASTAAEKPQSAPSIVLDAKPLASGVFDQAGLPAGGALSGISTGPGSGGGVGAGNGTGIGSGEGPGLGPGSGGGTGGGVYRPGARVSAPRVLKEVAPTYTTDALQHRIQGTVVLELVVTRDGCPSEIRVVRSLDPGGLDEQAIAAAAQWRFEPGRLAGTPVDVLVRIMLDFWMR